MFLVLLGAPGAGKGTQADIIARRMSLPHIASGDLFRQAVNKGTELGGLAKSYMDKGMLVPDEVTVQMVSERLNEPDCQYGCVFDGFPRNVDQGKALDVALEKGEKAVDKAIYIEVREAELLKRLTGRWICRNCQAPYHEVSSPPEVAGRCDKCGGELYQRSDDTVETIRERLKVYFAQTIPLLEYYEKTGKLLRVDGSQGIDGVAEQVADSLEGLQRAVK